MITSFKKGENPYKNENIIYLVNNHGDLQKSPT